MNGERYFQHFLDVADRIKDMDASPMAIKASGGLALKLADLYFLDGLPQVGMSPEPEVVTKSREMLSETTFMTGAQRIAKHMHFVAKARTEVISRADTMVVSGVTDPQEIKSFLCMRSERDGVNASIAEHHEIILSKSLVDLQRQATRGKPLDKKLVSRVIRESVNGQRKHLAEILAPLQYILLAHYDVDPASGVQQYQLDAIRNRDLPTPSWLLNETNPHGAGQLLSSFVSETDTLIALNEWVVDRGLPYLPVIAPVFYETGPYNRCTGNPHADMFLCSLLPDRNDIIPIQVKKAYVHDDKSKYIDGMVFLTPKDLGQDEQSRIIMRVRGRAVPGFRYTTRHGAISTQFMKLHNRRKGQQPTKVDRNVYAAQLQKAFTGLDDVLGDIVEAA